MKVVRFMTDMEKELYLSGARIVNTDPHYTNCSTCYGSCFAEITPERDADKWLRKLFFVRPCVWVVEFETDAFGDHPLNEGEARYASDNIEELGKPGTEIVVREWWTTDFSIATHPYTRIGRCPSLDGLVNGERIVWEQPQNNG